MWLNIFKMHYENFQIDRNDLNIYFELTSQFLINMVHEMDDMQPNFHAFQIIGTEQQSGCDALFRHRKYRITASMCNKVSTLGENLDRSVKVFCMVTRLKMFKSDVSFGFYSSKVSHMCDTGHYDYMHCFCVIFFVIKKLFFLKQYLVVAKMNRRKR